MTDRLTFTGYVTTGNVFEGSIDIEVDGEIYTVRAASIKSDRGLQGLEMNDKITFSISRIAAERAGLARPANTRAFADEAAILRRQGYSATDIEDLIGYRDIF